jgi:hypothetical protein
LLGLPLFLSASKTKILSLSFLLQGRNCSKPSRSHPYILAPAAISGKNQCQKVALLPRNSLRANSTFWHTVTVPSRPLELYGKPFQPFRDIVFDETMIVLGGNGWKEDGQTLTTVFTKTPLLASEDTNNNTFTWRRTYLSIPTPEELSQYQAVGINSKYIAIGVPGKWYGPGTTFTSGAAFLYSRHNLTAPPLRIEPLKPSEKFGTFVQMSGNTLAVTDYAGSLYIYKYNETNDSWNINSPVVLTSSGPRYEPWQVDFGRPIQLSGTTFIQFLDGTYDGTIDTFYNSVAVFDEDAAGTGNFTLSQYINISSINDPGTAFLGGGNLAIYSATGRGKPQKLTMYRQNTSSIDTVQWYQDHIITTTDVDNWTAGFSRISETSMVLRSRSPRGPSCAPESFIRHYSRDEMSGTWVEKPVKVTYSCESALKYKYAYSDPYSNGGFALYKNTMAFGGMFITGPLIPPPEVDVISRSPIVVLLYDL